MTRMPAAVEMDVAEGAEAEVARRATAAFGPSVTSRATEPDPEVPAKAQRRRFPAEYRLRILTQADACNCTSSNQSGPLRLRRKRDFLPLCRVVRRPLILSPSCS